MVEISDSTLDGLPLVTIITSVLNGSKAFEKTIDSVVAQTYSNIEYIVIDGDSTDGTVEIINRRRANINQWISEADQGIYDAWNKGLNLSHGQWIMFLGADDQLLPGSVELLVSELTKSGRTPDFVSGRVSRGGRVVGSPFEWKGFKKYCTVAHTGALHNRDYFSRHGIFDPEFRIAGDYELLLRAGKDLDALFVDQVVANMGEDGVSRANPRVFIENRIAKQRHYSRSAFLCFVDHGVAYAKWRIRRLIGNRFLGAR